MKRIGFLITFIMLTSIAFCQMSKIEGYFCSGCTPNSVAFDSLITNSYNNVTSGILYGTGYPSISFSPWSTKGAYRFYTDYTHPPTNTGWLGFDGNFYATNLISGGYPVLTTQSGGSSLLTSISATSPIAFNQSTGVISILGLSTLTPGTYNNPNITINSNGFITAISAGSTNYNNGIASTGTNTYGLGGTLNIGYTAINGASSYGGSQLYLGTSGTPLSVFQINSGFTDPAQMTLTDGVAQMSSGGSSVSCSGTGMSLTSMSTSTPITSITSSINLNNLVTPYMLITDNIGSTGLLYAADYSANYTARSIPDVGYVLSHGGVTPVSDILNWSTNKYTPYTFQNSGSFDNSSTFPVHGTRLNYDGNFYSFTNYSSSLHTNNVIGLAENPTGSFYGNYLINGASSTPQDAGLISMATIIYNNQPANGFLNFDIVNSNLSSLTKPFLNITHEVYGSPVIGSESSDFIDLSVISDVNTKWNGNFIKFKNLTATVFNVDKGGNVNIPTGSQYMINGNPLPFQPSYQYPAGSGATSGFVFNLLAGTNQYTFTPTANQTISGSTPYPTSMIGNYVVLIISPQGSIGYTISFDQSSIHAVGTGSGTISVPASGNSCVSMFIITSTTTMYQIGKTNIE